ncbi:tRNA(Ile)-lysidine synthase [Pseudonocardia autotrophica]|uniref:tRNA(Ile)-lysidine synthase n=1 Tax=Pseudonocardia autotrophica TaxID=2074 RepID=A0A1Y2MXB5_PSEAH|nr:tRNA(Ile)-lysidine synthase [Pseudonocardia autotrophica]TDN74409.1 tRNA(Ile)-lysidine synthase [Pseudonocardia autotrophica]
MRRVRAAVHEALDLLDDDARRAPPLVGCSGGADSSALVHAVRAVVDGPVHALVVDHGLQDGSAERSAALAAALCGAGVDAVVRRVRVAGPGGTEAAARRARRAALLAARPHPSSVVLLGHTLDDQAETVLLGLARGSGARSLAGMRRWSAPWLRPLLELRRADTVAACAELGLPVWADPHNADPRFTRVRVRREVLPLLEEVLGGGVARALARTAAQLGDDDEALTEAAARLRLLAEPSGPTGPTGSAEPTGPAGAPDRRAGPAGSPDRDDPGTAGPWPATPGDLPDPAPPAQPGDLGDSRTVLATSTEHPEPPAEGHRDPVAPPLDTAALAAAPAAVRRRVLREWLTGHGVRALTDEQLRRADDLVGRWRGQGGPTLGGGLELVRARGRLVLRHRRWGRDRA